MKKKKKKKTIKQKDEKQNKNKVPDYFPSHFHFFFLILTP